MIRTLAIAVSLWGLLAVGAKAQTRPHEERKVLERVEAKVARGRPDQATRTLLRALERAPSVTLLERYAELALPLRSPENRPEEAKFDAAAGRLLSWLSADPKQPLELSSRLVPYAAWALSLRSQVSVGLALMAHHGGSDPALTTRGLRTIAAWAIAQHSLVEAQAALKLARTFSPTDLDLATELGLVLLARGQAQEALLPLGERFAADRGRLPARRDFAYALRAVGRAAEAYELLMVTAEACTQAERCLLELGRTALEAGRFDQAVAHAEQLLQREPDTLDALFIAAEAHGRKGDPRVARLAYERILRAAPGNLRARGALSALDEKASGAP